MAKPPGQNFFDSQSIIKVYFDDHCSSSRKFFLSLILELLHLFSINAIVRHVEASFAHIPDMEIVSGCTHLNVATQVHL